MRSGCTLRRNWDDRWGHLALCDGDTALVSALLDPDGISYGKKDRPRHKYEVLCLLISKGVDDLWDELHLEYFLVA